MNEVPKVSLANDQVNWLPPSDSQADRILRLVHWTSAASRQLRRRLAEVAEALELSDTELLVVWLCSGGGRIQVELAGSIGVSPAQMSGMVERLRSRGLVAMHRLAADRRRQVWKTTTGGQALLIQAATNLNELANSVGDGLSDDEQHAAQSLCERLAQAVTQKALVAAALLLVVFASTGCSRTFYRRQADMDVYALVREKATHPHWRLPNYTISVDPRSRMYDPYQIDCPPIPPDDPTAHQLMHCVDNKRGWPFWHDNGDRPYVENPAWPEYIDVDEKGVLRLTADDAVRMALLNSRTYQQQLETLYLSALDVSFERFRFDAQFFSGQDALATFTGRANSGAARATGRGGNSSSEFATVNATGFRKLFPTGSELLVGFANSLIWQFSGSDNYTGSTILNFSLIQPLLRDAGRDRVLERLTRAERILLRNVRAMEQYRQGFYLNVITGQNAGNGPSRQGGQFGGGGLENFAGVGAGGFGQAGGGGGAGAVGGAGDAQGAGAQQAQNYLGFLQRQREISNSVDNVRRLRENVTRLTELVDLNSTTDVLLSQRLQVAQARQALLIEESRLLNQQNEFYRDLDVFKTNILGLPPQICIEPTDDMLSQFDLIDRNVIRLEENWQAILAANVAARLDIPARIQSNIQTMEVQPNLYRCSLAPYEGLAADLEALKEPLMQWKAFVDAIVTEHLPTIERDLERFRESAPRRKAWFERIHARIKELQESPCELLPLTSDPLQAAGGGPVFPKIARDLAERIDLELAQGESMFQTLMANFQRYSEELVKRRALVDELLANPNQNPQELFEKLVLGVYTPKYECAKTTFFTFDVVEDISTELTALQILQGVARAQSIELMQVDIRAEQALEVARKYRRDWMNERTTLVDQWRLLQFNADQLQSDLDVFFQGDIRNISDNPFRLRADTGSLRAGVQFDAPVTRLAERNNYRQSLIEYQQARRNYYFFEDTVARTLRLQLRTLATNEINFELNRQAFAQAAEQGLLTTSQLTTTARDRVQAITDLLNAQNNFMSVWVSYEVQRLSLDFSLGTMQLDNEGIWIDPGKIGPDYGQYDPWAWRTGQTDMENLPGTTGKQPAHSDLAIDELPPPFLLPPGNSDARSPAEAMPQAQPRGHER